MTQDLISVIIPAYNAENTILETIDSVLQQSYAKFELIVINDGSTDRTLELLQTIQNPKLKIFSYQNGGLSTARNRGIKHSQGQYLTFLDADDRWTTDKLELQLNALKQNPQAALAYSWVYFEYEDTKLSYADTSSYFTGKIYGELLKKNFLHNGSNALIKKEIIEKIGLFDADLKCCEDWDFYLRIAAEKEFVLVPKVQIFYRQSATSMTGNVIKMEYYLKLVIDNAFKVAPPELKHIKKQSLGWTYKYLAQQYLKYYSDRLSGIQAAGNSIFKAILYYPPNIFEDYTQSLIKKLIKKAIAKNNFLKL